MTQSATATGLGATRALVTDTPFPIHESAGLGVSGLGAGHGPWLPLCLAAGSGLGLRHSPVWAMSQAKGGAQKKFAVSPFFRTHPP